MSVDVVDLRSFYTSPLGYVARRFIGQEILRLWGSVAGLRVLGLGYTTPYLHIIKDESERSLAFMPAAQGVVNWPSQGLSSSCLVDPLMMPLPDSCMDRVLVVHALETVESPSELLSEIWRILTPGGRVLVVAPNRSGLWARMDATPFGHGQPFSRSQLKELMRRTMLSPEIWAETLYTPPLRSRTLLRSARLWERIGSSLALPFAGLHIVDATKQVYQPVRPIKARRRFQLRPVLLPVPSASPTSRNLT
jgi:SAM-dependent methyltransferase